MSHLFNTTKSNTSTINKSPSDDREYRAMTLDNKMKVLLISDPKTQTAAASLTVGVGSFSNGPVLGLAHFLEHMLFMGSTKYPDEDYYHKFVAQCGGGTNAYTSHDHTNYHFYVDPESFFQVLDVFAQFFVDPLLKTDALEREMKAVNAEHQKNINNDDWRTMEMRRLMSDKKSPLYDFSTGTVETLNVPNIRDVVINFYKSTYSANQMTLVVLSRDDLDKLEQVVKSIFTVVPNYDINTIYSFPKLFVDKTSMIEMVPIKNEDKLIIMWDVPHDIQAWDCHVLKYLSHMLGHEGKNTLTDILKNKYWIDALYAGSDGSYGGRTAIEVVVILTELGKQYVSEIINLVCAYIELIRNYGINKTYYNELKNSAYQRFTFADKQDPENYVTSLSAKIQLNHKHISMEHILASNATFQDFSQDIANILYSYISVLNASNMHVIYSSQMFRNKTMLTEKWYGVEYNMYQNLGCLNLTGHKNMELEGSLSLPKQNIYIPDNFQLVTRSESDKNMKHPEKYNLENGITLYYKCNTTKELPKTRVFCTVHSSWLDRSKQNRIALMMYLSTLLHMENSTHYMLDLAGYKFSLNPDGHKLIFEVSGISQKINLVLDSLIERLLTIILDENSYNTCKNMIIQDLNNYIFEAPYSQSSQILLTEIYPKHISPKEQLELLSAITFSDVVSGMTSLLSEHTNTTVFIYGNETLESSVVIANKFIPFVSQKQFVMTHEELMVIRQPEHSDPHKLFSQPVFNCKETNSVASVYFNLGYIRNGTTENWCKKVMLIKMFDSVISSRFFDQLRTKEGLGYIAKTQIGSSGYVQYPIYYYRFLVQSPEKNAAYLKERIDAFISTIKTIFIEMSEEELNKYIQSEINLQQCPFNSLSEEYRFMTDIVSKGHDIFHQKELKVEELKLMTKNDLVEFFDKSFVNGTSWTVLLDGSVNCK